jgi:flagellar M-ring protein FliF
VPFLANLAKLPGRSKAVLGLSVLAVIVVAFVLLRIAGAPAYTILSSGLDPAQTGKITAALDEQGIAYELRSNGTSLAVDKAQVAQARVTLAAQGVAVSGGGDEGWQLFDEQKLGASEMQQKVTFQRALEGEIAKTINAVSGVSGAQVQLVLPEDDLFADTETPATAAVMLGNPADTLESGAVAGIAQLTASSVKGLKKDQVTITDSTGQLLWPQGDAAGGAGGSGSSKQAAEARFDRALEANLNSMLTSTLGAGKARVTVNADLNVDQVKRNELKYAKKGVPQKVKTESEKLKGGSGRAGGTAGSGANIPTYSSGTAAGGTGSSNYQRSSKEQEVALDKTVSETIVAPGAVDKLNVALLIDKAVPAATVKSLQQTIGTAAGIVAARGVAITVTQMAFAKPEVPKAGPVPTTLLGPIKWAGLGLATLLFLFFTRRALKKREGEALATPSWLTDIEEPVALSALEQQTRELGGGVGEATIQLPPRVPDTSLRQLDQLMEREPERVAAQVKQWMADE